MEEREYKYSDGWNSQGYKTGMNGMDVSTILEQFLEKQDTYDEMKDKKTMKKCEVCMPDGNGKVSIGQGTIFISPTTTGFMLYSNPDGDIEIHCFADFDSLLGYMTDNKLMDMTQNTIASNI